MSKIEEVQYKDGKLTLVRIDGTVIENVSLGGGLAPAGPLSERPEASPDNAGQFYLATDVWSGTLFRSNGVSWGKAAKGAEEPDRNGVGRLVLPDHLLLHGVVAMTTVGTLLVPDWDGSPMDVFFDSPGTLERTDAVSAALGGLVTFQILTSLEGAGQLGYGAHSWKILTTTNGTWMSPIHYNWHLPNPGMGDLEIALQGQVNHANTRFTGTRFSDAVGPILYAEKA